MRRQPALAVLVLGLAAAPVAAQSVRSGGERRMPALEVASLRELAPFGKSVDWSPDGDEIVTSRYGADGFYDVVVIDLEGSVLVELTDGRPGCPQLHNGNPAWHPSGELVAFTAENPDVVGEDAHAIAIPGRGVNCNLWLARADGSAFWRLTDFATDYVEPQAVIHPQFSPDGSRLVWAEREANKAGTWWGEWAIRTARLVFDGPIPHLDDVVAYQPGVQRAFYEAHDWHRVAPYFLLSGNLEADQPEWGLDLYRLDLEGGAVRRLTRSGADWDEHGHWSPDGRYVAWMSSRGFDLDWSRFDGHNYGEILVTELWVMAADGSSPHRLTRFNDPASPEHIPYSEACIVSDSAWSPDGGQIVANVFCRMLGGTRTARLVLLDLAPALPSPGAGSGP